MIYYACEHFLRHKLLYKLFVVVFVFWEYFLRHRLLYKGHISALWGSNKRQHLDQKPKYILLFSWPKYILSIYHIHIHDNLSDQNTSSSFYCSAESSWRFSWWLIWWYGHDKNGLIPIGKRKMAARMPGIVKLSSISPPQYVHFLLN